MTKEEILAEVKMTTVLSERGIEVNRSGMCRCPIHGEKNPSMKIYKDGFKCFSCGASGNVIDFVMQCDGVNFKTAFVSLGGTYQHTTEEERRAMERVRARRRAERQRQQSAEKDFKLTLSKTITFNRKAVEVLEPFSDEWCYLQNKLVYLLHVWETKYEQGEEIDEIYVLGICREVRQKINSIC